MSIPYQQISSCTWDSSKDAMDHCEFWLWSGWELSSFSTLPSIGLPNRLESACMCCAAGSAMPTYIDMLFRTRCWQSSVVIAILTLCTIL